MRASLAFILLVAIVLPSCTTLPDGTSAVDWSSVLAVGGRVVEHIVAREQAEDAREELEQAARLENRQYRDRLAVAVIHAYGLWRNAPKPVDIAAVYAETEVWYAERFSSTILADYRRLSQKPMASRDDAEDFLLELLNDWLQGVEVRS